jgi:hypothetical protein
MVKPWAFKKIWRAWTSEPVEPRVRLLEKTEASVAHGAPPPAPDTGVQVKPAGQADEEEVGVRDTVFTAVDEATRVVKVRSALGIMVPVKSLEIMSR